MGELHGRIADALAAELEHCGWNERPAMYAIFLGKGPGRILELEKIQVPDRSWDNCVVRPADVLRLIAPAAARTLAAIASQSPPEDVEELHGFAFRHREWALAGLDSATGQERAAAAAAAGSHSIRSHPGRIEVRHFAAVDRAGTRYAAIQRRGSTQAERMIAYPGGPAVMDSSIMDSLDMLISAVTGAGPGRKGPALG